MTVIIILILISVSIAACFLLLFLWNVKEGQYDDMVTPSIRILFENPTESSASVPNDTGKQNPDEDHVLK